MLPAAPLLAPGALPPAACAALAVETRPQPAPGRGSRAALVGTLGAAVRAAVLCRVQRLRKTKPGTDWQQDPWREVPWAELPALSPKRAWRLQELQHDMQEAYGELIEPWEVRKAELEEIFRPNRCASTYGELDLGGVARLLEEAQLAPGHRFVDVGSGLGKLAVAAAALFEAESCGMEISPYRHQRALEGLQRLQKTKALSTGEAARVMLLCGSCGDVVPQELLEATHLILTMRRSTTAVRQLYQALEAYGPLPSGQPRVLWSVTRNLKMRRGMKFTRRFMIDGFELPESPGPKETRAGKVTQKMVVNQYLLAF
ncbi:unnamed protein product [Effrenium voratum]|nr:unnamed protein product [Effrenium voratum]